MKTINRWQCWIKTFWRTLGVFPDFTFDGHTYKDEGEYKDCTVTVSKCEVCDKYDISWTTKNNPPHLLP